jgi:hypothetical protein
MPIGFVGPALQGVYLVARLNSGVMHWDWVVRLQVF